MSKLTILHLSDMHFCDRNNYAMDNIRCIVNALHDNVIDTQYLLIIISGDVAYSGFEKQYIEFSSFLSDLKTTIGIREKQIEQIEVAIVPGNHDVDHNQGELEPDKLDRILNSGLQDDYIPKEIDKLGCFLSFSTKEMGVKQSKSLMQSIHYSFGNYSIQINLVNTAIFSTKMTGDEGYHYIPDSEIKKLTAFEDEDYIFTVMHHPHYWFEWNSRHSLSHELIEKSDIVFVGHEHFSSSENIEEDGFSVRFQEGGILSDRGDWGSSEFHIGVLELENRHYTDRIYRWNNTGEVYFPDSANVKILSKNRTNQFGFSLKQNYIDGIITDNRFLVGRDVREYYVFPLLEEKKEVEERRTRKIKEMGSFLDLIDSDHRLLIRGSKEAGKSILLGQTFLALQQRSAISLLVDQNDFTKVQHGKETVEEAIRHAMEREFSFDEFKYEEFIQRSAEDKAILIDDFDLIDAKTQKQIIEYIYYRYSRIVVTCQRDIEFDIIERARLETLLDKFQVFTICPFYKSKREQLITNIVRIRAKEPNEQIQVINSVCSLLRGTQQLYRWDPTFIIQLSVFASDNVQAMQIKEGNVFGTVFKASILNLLKPFLIKMDLDPDYTLAIIDKIAYSVYKKKIRVFSFEVINQVVTEYSDTYKYKCNSVNFTQALVEAQILKEVNQEYCFCHSTYYAFFVAREIRRICQDKHDTSDFVNALKEAYHPINLSIVLFVTYIMDSELLIKQILDGAVASVIDWPEFDPQKPKQTYFNKLEIPKIQLSEGMMVDKQNRQDEQEQKTDIKNQEIWTNPHYFENVDDDTSDVMLRLSLMIIVSQLLPNLGHRITGDDKMKFVQLIYSMPLQIFNKWADEIENDKVSIIQDIKQLGTLEYRNEATREMTDDEAIQYLRQESITILLELMDLSISTASRKTTDDLLDEYDFRSKVGYEIEWLISHEKRRNPKLFITEADKAYRKYKSGLPNVMIKMVVRHYLMNNRVLESRDIQQINQLFFEGKLPQRLLFLDSQEQWKRV